MAIRTINYEVKAGEITPKTEQAAGLQGESNVTDIKFTLDTNLHSNLAKLEGETRYRIEGTDGAGAFYSSDFLIYDGTSRTLTFPIGTEFSGAGGVVCLHLVISKLLDSGEESTLYSFPARLRFETTPLSQDSNREYRDGVSGALYAAKKAEESAKKANESAMLSADIAKEAQMKTEESKIALENGVEFAFLGGDAKSEVKTDLIIDSVLSTTSKNPVENQAVAKEFLKYTSTADADMRYLKHEDADMRYLKHEDADMRYLKHEDAADYFVEQGTSGIWTYEKRASGIAECWGNMVCSYSNQSLLIGECALPFEMTEYNIQGTLQYKETENVVDQRTLKMYNSSQTIYCHIYSDTLFPESYWLTVYVRIKGKWK